MAGMLWMLASGLCFVAVNAIVKYLGDALPASEAAFLRYALGLVFLVPMLRPILRNRYTLRSLSLFAARGVVHGMGVLLWFYAMARIPIAEVTAINYLAPVYVTIGAALFLGEQLAARRIVAVLVALLGVAVIVRPGFAAVSSGELAMLGVAVFFAASYLIAKKLADEAPAPVVVAMLSITVTIALAPMAASNWVTPAWHEVIWLSIVAAFATAGHLCMTHAFRLAPVTVTQPVTFLQLIWATAIGAIWFNEPVDIWVVTGGGMIIAAVSFITWREAVIKRRLVTPVVNQMKG
ncbi:peptide ABC transporter permease [Allgaiera indica]|uniref:Peptide ABC transporter permease n=1 Tax=Allgaiera indica TaxID=765699 RepID=A0AAN4ZZ45_9RHOB|nr:DMT family transporter [Allgaiera indica]GHD99425.1 peptide ABC transporter permease [Allgaiera indica]SDW25909.1 Threonine/homoserine efflux transporter RhtA [Allgaiera indica]